MPNPDALKKHKYLKIFGDLIDRPGIWHLNRRSAAGALAAGMFVAWIPVPFQMVLAAGAAILMGVNLPLAVVTVWFTNPVTMPVMFYLAYVVGAKLLGNELQAFNFELSWQWLEQSLGQIGEPFLLGCLVLGVASAIFTYFVINSLWKYSILFNWRKRRKQRRRFGG